MTEWISAVAAGVSALIALVGMVVSWRKSSESRQSKEHAEIAESRAAEHERLAREQNESLSSLAGSMKELVADARSRAEETRVGAEEASASAEAARLSAEALASMQQQLERIAEASEPRQQVTIREVSNSRFVMKNNRATSLECEYVRNRTDFARLDLEDKFTIPPGGQKSFLVVEAWGYSVPDNLVLDEVGLDAPTVIPIER